MKKKFKPSIALGGDEAGYVADNGIYLLGGNRITPAQALRLAEWLKDAVADIRASKKSAKKSVKK